MCPKNINIQMPVVGPLRRTSSVTVTVRYNYQYLIGLPVAVSRDGHEREA